MTFHPIANSRRGARSKYSVFYYDLRRELGLSANEYLLADLVHHLSGERSRFPGWCYASRQFMAATVGLSRRGVQVNLARLRAKGLIEDHPEHAGWLRTTPAWRRRHARISARRSS